MLSKFSVVGDCIRVERRRAGLSQDQLAERLHVTRQTISNWKGRKSLPDIESLKSLAEALEIPIEYLIYGEIGCRPQRAAWPAAKILVPLARHRGPGHRVSVWDPQRHLYQPAGTSGLATF